MAPPTSPWEISAPTSEVEADVVADAVIRSRPFASPSELVLAEDEQGRPVFGNRDQYAGGSRIQWTDSAAEEVFARVFEASTVRSRNFRLWVIGQSVGPVPGSGGEPPVLAESRLVFNLFSDPGERDPDGSLIEENHRVKVIHETLTRNIVVLLAGLLPLAAQDRPEVGFIRMVHALAPGEGKMQLFVDGENMFPKGYDLGQRTGGSGLPRDRGRSR